MLGEGVRGLRCARFGREREGGKEFKKEETFKRRKTNDFNNKKTDKIDNNK
jgi:hypothetical protein